jgi:hypothetical protein
MAVKLNPAALDFAKQLLDDDQYMINTQWSQNEPTAEEENRYLEGHGWQEYARWYLGVDPDAPADTKAHYQFPYGNFQKLHRSGVMAVKQRAAQNQYEDVVEGADELLDVLDRMNAC